MEYQSVSSVGGSAGNPVGLGLIVGLHKKIFKQNEIMH